MNIRYYYYYYYYYSKQFYMLIKNLLKGTSIPSASYGSLSATNGISETQLSSHMPVYTRMNDGRIHFFHL